MGDQGEIEFFDESLQEGEVRKWKKTIGGQVIGQAELLPVLIAARLWSRRLRGRRVISYIDNDSARFALINGASPNESSLRVLWDYYSILCELGSLAWYARVPSPSNPGDGPSRLDFGMATKWGGRKLLPTVQQLCIP